MLTTSSAPHPHTHTHAHARTHTPRTHTHDASSTTVCNGAQHIFRGHEAQKSGVGVSKKERLTTIFSTSKDHFKGDRAATCGCVLVNKGSIRPIVRAVPEEEPSAPCIPWPALIGAGAAAAGGGNGGVSLKHDESAAHRLVEEALDASASGHYNGSYHNGSKHNGSSGGERSSTAPSDARADAHTGVQRVREATGSFGATLSNSLLGKPLQMQVCVCEREREREREKERKREKERERERERLSTSCSGVPVLMRLEYTS